VPDDAAWEADATGTDARGAVAPKTVQPARPEPFEVDQIFVRIGAHAASPMTFGFLRGRLTIARAEDAPCQQVGLPLLVLAPCTALMVPVGERPQQNRQDTAPRHAGNVRDQRGHKTSRSEPLAPGMIRWPSFGMCLQKMVQYMQQVQDVFLVTADLSFSNIVNDHVPDFVNAGRFGQKVLSECCCSDFREVFVLGDSEYLVFGQAA
jgi:hypothetical protein